MSGLEQIYRPNDDSQRQRRQDLADFLRTRRTRLSPQEVGLPLGRRRRTPGLRREEVAELANLGVSWYTALEQGRDVHPSEQVLSSLAHALRLTAVEQQHLFLLANQFRPPEPLNEPVQENVSATLQQLLNTLEPNPACVMGRYWDYLAWNNTACRLFNISKTTTRYPYNFVWRFFTEQAAKEMYPDWAYRAQKILAEFRADSARYTDDQHFKMLIHDLQTISPDFTYWWQRHDVRSIIDNTKEIYHPILGLLKFEHTLLQVSHQPDLKVMVYLPQGDTTDGLNGLQTQL